MNRAVYRDVIAFCGALLSLELGPYVILSAARIRTQLLPTTQLKKYIKHQMQKMQDTAKSYTQITTFQNCHSGD